MNCACGCGRPVTSTRPGARYASPACRARASRARGIGALSANDCAALRIAARMLTKLCGDPTQTSTRLTTIADRSDQLRLSLRQAAQDAHVRHGNGVVPP